MLFDNDTYESRKYDLFPNHRYSFVSYRQQQTYIDRYGIKNCKVVYNGVNVGTYFHVNKAERKYILYVGRMLEEKGFHDALELSARIDMPLAYCTSDADKKTVYYRSLIPKINAVGAQDLGFVSGTMREETYRKALFTIFPATWNDSFGMVITESMAQGTPVIGYDTGAVTEIIEDGRSGYVVPSSNIIEMRVRGLENASRKLMGMTDTEYANMSYSAYIQVKDNFFDCKNGRRL